MKGQLFWHQCQAPSAKIEARFGVLLKEVQAEHPFEIKEPWAGAQPHGGSATRTSPNRASRITKRDPASGAMKPTALSRRSVPRLIADWGLPVLSIRWTSKVIWPASGTLSGTTYQPCGCRNKGTVTSLSAAVTPASEQARPPLMLFPFFRPAEELDSVDYRVAENVLRRHPRLFDADNHLHRRRLDTPPTAIVGQNSSS